MKWTNSYRSFGLKTKRSTGLKTIEHKQSGQPAGRRPARRAAGSSRHAADGPGSGHAAAAWPPGARRRPAASSRPMPVPSWPCTGAARRAPGRRRRAGIGRGWVMDIMREPGVRGVRRGGTSVTARPAKGRGRRARPRGTRVRGGAPGPAARGRHRLRAHGQRTLRLHGARPPTCSPAGVCDQIKVFGVRW